MSSGLLGTGAEDWGGNVKGNARRHVPPVISPPASTLCSRGSRTAHGGGTHARNATQSVIGATRVAVWTSCRRRKTMRNVALITQSARRSGAPADGGGRRLTTGASPSSRYLEWRYRYLHRNRGVSLRAQAARPPAERGSACWPARARGPPDTCPPPRSRPPYRRSRQNAAAHSS